MHVRAHVRALLFFFWGGGMDMPVHMPVHMHAHMSVHMPTHMSIHASAHILMPMPIHERVTKLFPPSYLFIDLFLFIYIFQIISIYITNSP